MLKYWKGKHIVLKKKVQWSPSNQDTLDIRCRALHSSGHLTNKDFCAVTVGVIGTSVHVGVAGGTCEEVGESQGQLCDP